MYGTVARMRVQQGKLDELKRLGREISAQIPGFVWEHVYQMDADPNECILVVAFESREAYHRNAQSPEQAERYLKIRALLDADPQWHDGEIIDSYPG